MRFTTLFAPTLREAPSEAEVISHKLLIRSGMIRKVAAGIYTFLPLGKKVLSKVENIIREEMDATGAQEVLMPVLQPKELWEESGRWDEYGPELMRLKDRSERFFALGPTHEELITNLVANNIRSYKELPKTLYQIQVKFRDEIRPRFGLMRGREFIMKDAYSFHTTQKSLEKTYLDMSKAYSSIVKRCGLNFKSVEADSGIIGGKVSEEFMVLAGSGEEIVAMCSNCHYSSSLEQAKTKLIPPIKEKQLKLERADTPNKITVDEVSAFLSKTPLDIAKTLVYLCDNKPLMAVVRGDRDASEAKVRKAAGCNEIRLFTDEDFKRFPDIVKGYVSPVDMPYEVIVDEEIPVITNLVAGGNQPNTHYVNVNYERDFKAGKIADIKYVKAGDICPACDGSLETTKGIEIGHIFQLGTKYSKSLGADYLDKNGKTKPMIMGCYGIGVTRLLSASIEQHHDERGIIWPKNLAPYIVSIIQLNNSDKAHKTADDLYRKFIFKKIEAVWDDRDERAGVKFADNDLIGFPLQVIVGKKVDQDIVEVKNRQTGKILELKINETVKFINELIGTLY